MRKLSTKLVGQQSGFTLIELVIVIVIIGILAAVALPNFSDITGDANTAKKNAILGSVKSAYAIALAKKQGGVVTSGNVAFQQTDPSCGVTTDSGNAASYTCGTATINFANPSGILSSADITLGT